MHGPTTDRRGLLTDDALDRPAERAAAATALPMTTHLQWTGAAGGPVHRRPAARAATAARPRPWEDGPASALVRQWYDLTDQAVTAAAYPEPVTQSQAWAVSWLAAGRALRRPGGGWPAAAFSSALHDVLAALVPAYQPQLDAALAATLSTVPAGPARGRAVAAGQEQATLVLAQRSGDGLDTASVGIPWTPPPAAPGAWQPTPPAFGPAIRAGEGKARPFLLATGGQFRPGPPAALTSGAYLRSLAEVYAIGGAASTIRTAGQTSTALFWEPAPNVLYVQVLRAALAGGGLPFRRQVALVAAFHVITTDAQIASYDAKYSYVFWRPVTAIQTGTIDHDPGWATVFPTPRHPEYPSGHCGYAGAAERVLTAFLGPRPAQPVSATSPDAPGITHTWTAWSQITAENINARVWGGIHFRSSDETGTQLGRQVADYGLARLAALDLPGRAA